MAEKKARGPQRLTNGQRILLDKVSDTDNAYRLAKKSIAKQVREAVEKEIAGYAQIRAAAVYAAVEAGVPKSRIAQEGLGTTGTNEIYEIIADVERSMILGMPEVPAAPRFTVLYRGMTGYGPYMYIGDSEAFVNPVFEGTPQIEAHEGFLFVKAIKWVQWPNQAAEEPAPEGMLEFVLANAEEE